MWLFFIVPIFTLSWGQRRALGLLGWITSKFAINKRFGVWWWFLRPSWTLSRDRTTHPKPVCCLALTTVLASFRLPPWPTIFDEQTVVMESNNGSPGPLHFHCIWTCSIKVRFVTGGMDQSKIIGHFDPRLWTHFILSRKLLITPSRWSYQHENHAFIVTVKCRHWEETIKALELAKMAVRDTRSCDPGKQWIY